MTFERKRKYLVLKTDDIDSYLNTSEQCALLNICHIIGHGRELDGKKDNSYVVVNEDEPYAEKVWALIEKGEEGKA